MRYATTARRLSGKMLAVIGCMLCADAALALGAGPESVCRAAAEKASRQTGVPLSVLQAISLTESGRKGSQGFSAWPWTLNIEGRGEWLPDRASALKMAQATLASGIRSFDVGCFQVNYRWHGEAFASLSDMMDPETNALYAAQFMAGLYGEAGNWSAAAGMYHSRTPEHANRYRKTFDRHLATLGDAPLPMPEVAQLVVRENRYPLLQGGGPTRLGSLMPAAASSATSLLSAPARPFWSGS